MLNPPPTSWFSLFISSLSHSHLQKHISWILFPYFSHLSWGGVPRKTPGPLGQIHRGWNLHLASVSKAVKHNSQHADSLTCHWYCATTALHHYSHFLLRFSPGSCSLVIFAASWWNTLTVIHDYSSPSAFFLHLSLVRLPPLLTAFLRSCLCSRKPLFYS